MPRECVLLEGEGPLPGHSVQKALQGLTEAGATPSPTATGVLPNRSACLVPPNPRAAAQRVAAPEVFQGQSLTPARQAKRPILPDSVQKPPPGRTPTCRILTKVRSPAKITMRISRSSIHSKRRFMMIQLRKISAQANAE